MHVLTEIRDHHQVIDFPVRLDGQQPAPIGGQCKRGEDPARVLFEPEDGVTCRVAKLKKRTLCRAWFSLAMK
jgi:hypothetical protein